MFAKMKSEKITLPPTTSTHQPEAKKVWIRKMVSQQSLCTLVGNLGIIKAGKFDRIIHCFWHLGKMIPQNFKHLGFNYVKFVTKACRHGTSHPQHPRTIVSKRGIAVVVIPQTMEVGGNIIHRNRCC